MSHSPQDWQIQLALGACRASRLLAGASLAFAFFALAMLIGGFVPMSNIARGLWSGVVLALVPSLYLGVRLELDRHLFEHLAMTQVGDGAALITLDQAMADLGWRMPDAPVRPLQSRVQGVFRLTRRLGALVLLQVIAALAATLMF